MNSSRKRPASSLASDPQSSNANEERPCDFTKTSAGILPEDFVHSQYEEQNEEETLCPVWGAEGS